MSQSEQDPGGPGRTPTLVEIEQAVLGEAEWIEGFLARLIEAPTVGDEEPGQRVMAEALRETGLEPVDVWMDADALRAEPHASPFSWDVSKKRNVVATWSPEGESAPGARSLVLNGHVDVVPADSGRENWAHPPFEAVRDGDWVYGRGAADMKAGLAAMVGAVRALIRMGCVPEAPVYLESVVEEECSGNGALQCRLERPAADACIVTEPHHDRLATAQLGIQWFDVRVSGEPAHTKDASHLGANAIDAIAVITEELRELERELNADPPGQYAGMPHPINLNLGKIQGGDWRSTVAAECVASYRLATYPGWPLSDLRRRIESAVAAAAARHPFLSVHPPVVTYDGLSCEGIEVAKDEPLVTSLHQACADMLGRELTRRPTTGTTDTRAFVQRGIPAICFGPHGERLHGVDERVSLSSTIDTAKVLALFIRDWCGLRATDTAVEGSQPSSVAPYTSDEGPLHRAH
jgi:acetylornithine deacetylase